MTIGTMTVGAMTVEQAVFVDDVLSTLWRGSTKAGREGSTKAGREGSL